MKFFLFEKYFWLLLLFVLTLASCTDVFAYTNDCDNTTPEYSSCLAITERQETINANLETLNTYILDSNHTNFTEMIFENLGLWFVFIVICYFFLPYFKSLFVYLLKIFLP